METNYCPTGNEMVSLPRLNERTAGIEDLTFLHMGYKGLVDLRGGAHTPLIEPFIQADGADCPLEGLRWSRLGFWVPRFTGKAGPLDVEGVVLTPVEERGFVIRLELHNRGDAARAVKFGLKGLWASAWHCVNEDKPLEGSKHCFESAWNGSLVFDMRCGAPMFAFAPMCDAPCTSAFAEAEDGIAYRLECCCELAPGARRAVSFYWGLGFEEVAAATSAKEMLRQGYEYERERTLRWLEARVCRFADEALTGLYNLNLFFCIFFSTGVTLDSEELVLVTSRSPRYYVSAAYWDRDSLLWSFPAVLDADPALARRMLEYAFGRQRRNFGVHSRLIDGTVLEPGFELDELMAPVLALERYTDATGDRSLLEEGDVKKGVRSVLEKLAQRRHPDTALYSTFLQPTDDERVYPYLTYDNVLVWRALRALARLYPEHGGLAEGAAAVHAAIRTHCVKTRDKTPCYAWSVDLAGHWDVYDEPPGSLLLLPWLGFCEQDDEIWRNTVEIICAPEYAYSFAGHPIAMIGCPHAPHPWLLSIANSLLCGRRDKCLEILRNIRMDNGIACESVHEDTGECTTGEAFATCAGFLCHAIKAAFAGEKSE